MHYLHFAGKNPRREGIGSTIEIPTVINTVKSVFSWPLIIWCYYHHHGNDINITPSPTCPDKVSTRFFCLSSEDLICCISPCRNEVILFTKRLPYVHSSVRLFIDLPIHAFSLPIISGKFGFRCFYFIKASDTVCVHEIFLKL